MKVKHILAYKPVFNVLLSIGLAGALLPSAFARPLVVISVGDDGVQQFDPLKTEFVVEEIYGSSVEIKADAAYVAGTVGVQAQGWTSVGFYDPESEALHVDLVSTADSVGLEVMQAQAGPEDSRVSNFGVYGKAFIRAQTAIEGAGTVEFHDSAYIEGALKMQQGQIIVRGSQFQYAGDGELQTLRVMGHQTSIELGSDDSASAILRVDELNLIDGSVAVHGAQTQDGVYKQGSALLLQSLTNTLRPEDWEEQAQRTSISVDGNGVLALGTHLDRANDKLDAKIRENIADFDDLSQSQQVRARLAYILADANSYTNRLNQSTLITSAGLLESAVPETVRVTVGSVEDKGDTGGIYLGSDARWILYFGEDSQEEKLSAGAYEDKQKAIDQPLTAFAEGDAQLVIYGWNGKDALPDLRLSNFALENVYSINGVRTHIVDGKIARQWCWQFDDLASKDIVKAAEESYEWGDSELRPGYSFLVDSFDPDRVGPDAYAAVVDSAVFLPAASGAAHTLERLERHALDAVLSHDRSELKEHGHWWVHAQNARFDVPGLLKTGGKSRSIEADAVYGALGYDFGFADNWVGTVAVSYADADVESKETFGFIQSKAASASIFASAARFFSDGSLLQIALGYTRGEIEAAENVNDHRLESEPTLDIATAAVRWQKRFGGKYYAAPLFEASLHYGRMNDADVTDQTESTSGVGFKAELDDRLWAWAGVGAAFGAQVEAAGFRIRPQLELSARVLMGESSWTITSELADSGVSSRADFEGAARRSVRAAGMLEIASSETFAAAADRGDSREKPWAWSLAASAAFEASEASERTVLFGVKFRQLF